MAHQKISDLPNSWIVTKLPDAIDLILGQSPASSDCNSDGHGLPFFQGKTEFGKVYPKVRKYCTAPKKLAEKNDVLLSVRAPVGPTNLATEKCAIGRGLAALRTNSDIDFKYLLFYMRHIEPWLSEQGTGSTFKAVSGVFLKELDFFVSPLPEQKRIVEKLDCLLAQVDTIQQRLNNLPDIIKRFRQSVLAAAVSGKLTEQWRGENPVTSLKPNDYFDKKLGDVENKEYYGEPPPSWCWVRFGSIVKLINGDRGKNYPNKSEYVEVGVPFINTGHIDPNGSLSISRMNFITKDKFKSLGSGKIQTNDLVYCLRGATMGKTAIVNNFEKGAIASSLVIVRPSDSVNYKFAYYFLISPQAKDLITKFDNGSAQPNLSAKSLAMYPLCLPSLKEQTEIVRLVEQYFALADTLEKNLANAKQRVDNLTQSILAKAFRGELVPQDPNDEPADKLLARIKAARLEAEKLEKAAKKAAKASKK